MALVDVRLIHWSFNKRIEFPFRYPLSLILNSKSCGYRKGIICYFFNEILCARWFSSNHLNLLASNSGVRRPKNGANSSPRLRLNVFLL